jgi:hypothetical protein
LERRKTMGAVEELSVPSLGCSALDAKLERIDQEWNDLSRINLPALGSDPSLINQDRSGTWWFGG